MAKKKAEPVVYALRTVSDPAYIKIGFSKNFPARKNSIQASCPHELEVAAVVEGDECLERMILRYLRDHRVRGEWFESNDFVEGLIEVLADGSHMRQLITHMEDFEFTHIAKLRDKILKKMDKKKIEQMPD